MEENSEILINLANTCIGKYRYSAAFNQDINLLRPFIGKNPANLNDGKCENMNGWPLKFEGALVAGIEFSRSKISHAGLLRY